MAEESSFGTVEAECGKVTDSQEERLRDLAFIASDDTAVDDDDDSHRISDYPGGVRVLTISDTRSSDSGGAEIAHPGDHNSHHREEEVSPPLEASLKSPEAEELPEEDLSQDGVRVGFRRSRRMKTRASKRKFLPEESDSSRVKKLRAAAVVVSDESTQEPEEGDVGKDRLMESPMVPMIGESAVGFEEGGKLPQPGQEAIPQFDTNDKQEEFKSPSPKDTIGSSKPATEGVIIGLRKLPPSILSVEGGEVGVSAGSSTRIPSRSQPEVLNDNAGATVPSLPPSDLGLPSEEDQAAKAYPDDFFDIMVKLSKKHTTRFEGMDILEVAAMKGIRFSPPKWWRAGGYDP